MRCLSAMYIYSFISSGAYQFVPEFGAPMNFQRLFSEGEHYIEYRAVDIEGQSGTCSFKVAVRGSYINFVIR
jgi:hypothetical protein